MPRLGDQLWTQHRDSAQGHRTRAPLALPWPPGGINPIPSRCLNKHTLGVLLTSGEEPEALEGLRDVESSFCTPYWFSQSRSPGAQQWLLAPIKHSDFDWTAI